MLDLAGLSCMASASARQKPSFGGDNHPDTPVKMIVV
jgi:hypothetical protein